MSSREAIYTISTLALFIERKAARKANPVSAQDVREVGRIVVELERIGRLLKAIDTRKANGYRTTDAEKRDEKARSRLSRRALNLCAPFGFHKVFQTFEPAAGSGLALYLSAEDERAYRAHNL